MKFCRTPVVSDRLHSCQKRFLLHLFMRRGIKQTVTNYITQFYTAFFSQGEGDHQNSLDHCIHSMEERMKEVHFIDNAIQQ